MFSQPTRSRPLFSQSVAIFLSEALTRLTDRLLNHLRAHGSAHVHAQKNTPATVLAFFCLFFSPPAFDGSGLDVPLTS